MQGIVKSPVTGEEYKIEVTPEVYGESFGLTDPRWRDDCGSQVTVTHKRTGKMYHRWVDSLSIALGGERDHIQALAEKLDAEWQGVAA